MFFWVSSIHPQNRYYSKTAFLPKQLTYSPLVSTAQKNLKTVLAVWVITQIDRRKRDLEKYISVPKLYLSLK